METAICVECGQSFTYARKRGRPPEVCSDECKRTHLQRNWRESKRRHAKLPHPPADDDDEGYNYDTGNYYDW